MWASVAFARRPQCCCLDPKSTKGLQPPLLVARASAVSRKQATPHIRSGRGSTIDCNSKQVLSDSTRADRCQGPILHCTGHLLADSSLLMSAQQLQEGSSLAWTSSSIYRQPLGKLLLDVDCPAALRGQLAGMDTLRTAHLRVRPKKISLDILTYPKIS